MTYVLLDIATLVQNMEIRENRASSGTHLTRKVGT